MFRHYRVILRELVISTSPSYTSIPNAALVRQFKIKKFYIGSMHDLIIVVDAS